MHKRLPIAAFLAMGIVCLLVTPGVAAIFTSFAAFQAATFGLTTDDFESAPWVVGTQTQPTVNLGVSWTSVNDLFTSVARANSGSQSISDVNGSPDSIDEINAALPGGIHAVGAWINNFGDLSGQDDNVTMTAYDAANNVLGSVTHFDSASWSFIGVTSNTAIDRVRFMSSGPTPGDDFLVDDFTFGQVVPEPSTLVLLGVALGAAGGRRLRRRKSA